MDNNINDNIKIKILQLKRVNIFAIIIIFILGLIGLLINGLPNSACAINKIAFHYVVMISFIIFLPLGYIIYIGMIRKAVKTDAISDKLKSFYHAHYIRSIFFGLPGIIAGIAYIIEPIKNYILLLTAIIIIMLIYWPTVKRAKLELQMTESSYKDEPNTEKQ
ncbi:MAG TPA: hypothetical protein P5250_01160 [Bacteroidales bacterium]|nr:hypothetical protein [Bacteroidales bacterium]